MDIQVRRPGATLAHRRDPRGTRADIDSTTGKRTSGRVPTTLNPPAPTPCLRPRPRGPPSLVEHRTGPSLWSGGRGDTSEGRWVSAPTSRVTSLGPSTRHGPSTERRRRGTTRRPELPAPVFYPAPFPVPVYHPARSSVVFPSPPLVPLWVSDPFTPLRRFPPQAPTSVDRRGPAIGVEVADDRRPGAREPRTLPTPGPTPGSPPLSSASG